MQRITLGILGLWLAASLASAQAGPSGGLSGTVTDPSSQIIAGATVTVRNTETALTREVKSNETGYWEVRFLPTGKYEVAVTMDGFQRLVLQEVAVEASVVATVPAEMRIGNITEAVTVVADIPLVTPTSVAVTRQLDTRELLQVPTSTRSFTHLLSAEPGVSADLPPALVNGNGNISPSVNGLRTTSNSVQFNGIDATNLSNNQGTLTDNISPSPESLEEVKLQTSMYDASTGRSGGGNFQLVTRSGTNDVHGALYGFFQNEALNANDYFYNRDGINRPRGRRRETGATFGGPLKKDRLFYFGSYQNTDASTGFVASAQSLSHLPNALGLIQGDRTAQALYDAFKQANPNFTLTGPAQISPIALKIFQLRNPSTGDYVIPSPAGRTAAGSTTDATGNPLTLVRQVQPATFSQNQFTTKLDGQLSSANRLSGTFFWANFPGYDPFPDPSSLTSPFTLERGDRSRTLALSDVHAFGATVTNEARFGFHFLNNSRALDSSFDTLTNEAIGVTNPASQFDDSIATRRMGHYIFRGPRVSFGGPNDSYNKRDQQSYTFSDTVSWFAGKHSLRMGIEFKHHRYASNLPEEQATEFEKFASFDQLMRGLAQEADTQYGITAKTFKMMDAGWFIADDYKLTPKLTLNLGVRWDWFGWPVEQNGLFGNFDFSKLTNTEDPTNAFVVPSNFKPTGIQAIDVAAGTAIRSGNNHTLNGQDLNNFQPRIGFAWSPNGKTVVRGGYGLFFDRPSASFMNTVFSNYPFLREVEVTFPSAAVPIATAFSQQNLALPFNRYLPNRAVFIGNAASGNYQLRDNTGVTVGADGVTPNPIDPSTGQPVLGNVAETFEFRAVDMNLRTPYIQQWNFSIQQQFSDSMMFEVRYIGTKGTKLLQSVALNQGYDLNDPSTPDHIYQRLINAYVAAGSPRGTLPATGTARERGAGLAFGFPNPSTGRIDYNFGRPVPNTTTNVLIPFELRAPILGFNIPEALVLQNGANSSYHSAQVAVNRRFARGLQFRLAYTLSKAIDTMSSDPGSTAGGGRSDVPNTGFVMQGDQRNLAANRGLSDFDRTHRFSLSYSWDVPTGGSMNRFVRGWSLSGFMQGQSGSPFSIWFPEPEANTTAQLASLGNGSGGYYRLGFGRPNLAPGATLSDLRQQGSDPTTRYFNTSVLASAGGGFGNIGRNVLRGPRQFRWDFALSKETRLTERLNLEIRGEMFNVLNNVNFGQPVGDLSDSQLGQITDTVGGPRTMQFGARFRF